MTFETSLLNFHREKNQNHKVINKSHRKVIQKQQHVALIRSFFLNGESTTMRHFTLCTANPLFYTYKKNAKHHDGQVLPDTHLVQSTNAKKK